MIYGGYNGTTWDFQAVGPNSLAIGAGPIATDSKGNVHITYMGDDDGFRYVNEVEYCMYATASQPIYFPTPYSPLRHTEPLPILTIVTLGVVMLVSISLAVYLKRGKIMRLGKNEAKTKEGIKK